MARPVRNPPDRHVTVRWAEADGGGRQHLELRLAARSQGVVSVVVGTSDGVPFGASYRMLLGPDWTFRSLHLDRGLAGVRKIARSTRGVWTVDRVVAPALAGCVDIDISITPFTNSLPIHRLGLAEGGFADISVAHLEPPDYLPRVARQRYTCLSRGRRYLYEDATFGFRAEIEVDDDGLVIDYPGLFRRVWD